MKVTENIKICNVVKERKSQSDSYITDILNSYTHLLIGKILLLYILAIKKKHKCRLTSEGITKYSENKYASLSSAIISWLQTTL